MTSSLHSARDMGKPDERPWSREASEKTSMSGLGCHLPRRLPKSWIKTKQKRSMLQFHHPLVPKHKTLEKWERKLTGWCKYEAEGEYVCDGAGLLVPGHSSRSFAQAKNLVNLILPPLDQTVHVRSVRNVILHRVIQEICHVFRGGQGE